MVIVLDIIQQQYLIISLNLKLLDGEGLVLVPQMELAHPWDLEYFQMAIINIQVNLDRSNIEIVLEC